MSNLNLLKFFKIFNCETSGKINGDIIILLQEWNLIPKSGEYKCPRGHNLKVVSRNDTIDGFVWR
jgi:hypothetical protein